MSGNGPKLSSRDVDESTLDGEHIGDLEDFDFDFDEDFEEECEYDVEEDRGFA